MAIGSLTIDLNARLANIERDMGRAAHIAEQNGQRMQAAFTKAGTAFTAFAGALGVGGLAAFVKSSIDAADNLNDLSKKTGVAVENLAGLQLVVDKSGTSMEMLGGGVAKLNKTMGEAANGNKEAAATLKALGITATDPMEAFYQLADAFGRFKTEGDKAAAMSKVIGKTWTELAPALAEGGEGLRRMVEEGKRLNPITKEMAEQADKFNDALARMKAAAAGAGTGIGTALLPSLNNLLTQMSEGIRIAGSFGEALKLGLSVNPFNSPGENLKGIRDEIKTLQAMRDDLSGGAKASVKYKDGRVFFGYDISAIDAEIADLKKRAEYVKVLRAQALGLPTKSEMALEAARQAAEAAQAVRGKIAIPGGATGTGKAAKATDPLAGLLGQTDTALIADVSSKLILLDQRWQAGKLGAEQYAQAVDILTKKLAALNPDTSVDVFGNGSYIADPATAEMIKAQQEAINGLNAAMAGDAAQAAEDYKARLAGLMADTDIAKTAEMQANIDFLNQAFFDGVIGAEQYNQAIGNLTGKAAPLADEVDLVAEAWKKAAQSMEGALADFLFDPFKDGLDGMLLGFVNVIRRMAAEALAAQLMKSIFGTSGIAGAFGSLFGGAKAEGGPLDPGKWYVAGEHGPEPIWGGGTGAFAVGYQDQAKLAAARPMPAQSSQASRPQDVRVVLVDDQRRIGDYLATPAGERLIVNAVRRNAGAMRGVLV